MAETVPPSIAMLILGTVTPVSIGTLFIAGLIPAAVIAVLLMLMIYFFARSSHVIPSAKATAAERARTGADAILPLGMPIMMILGIKFGIATPTEVSSLAVLYGLVIATVCYRALTLKGFIRILIDSGRLTGMVLFIVAAAGAFGWTLTSRPECATVTHCAWAMLSNSQVLFLVGIVVLLIVVGALLEGLRRSLFLPILMPIANQLSIDYDSLHGDYSCHR